MAVAESWIIGTGTRLCRNVDAGIEELVGGALADTQTAWSLGSLGAIAEFLRAEDEPASVDDLTVRTARGAISVDPSARARPLAHEALTRGVARWRQGVSLVLDAELAQMGRRRVVTELGEDRDSIDPAHRGDRLVDLGLGLPHVDACIRTSDPDLLAIVRERAGQRLLESANPLVGALLAASPHRVFRSRLARIEVYGQIPSEATPLAPHTHLLPRLLATGRTHSANVPLPVGSLSVLDMHPPHPLVRVDGERRPVDPEAHDRFQAWLRRWGCAEHLAEKARVLACIAGPDAHHRYQEPSTRVGRTALRVTLRQLASLGGAPPQHVARWRERFDQAGAAA